SFYSRRVVAVYDQPSEKKLLAVIAHETTHLLFESWWAEGSRQNPPDWLNEGLAMVEEAPPEQIGHSDWYEAMAALPKSDTLDLKRLMSLSPTADLHDRRARVSAWYVQSYSLVYFLLRKHSPLQFKSLCKDLRDGVEVEKALWLVYHYRSYRQLQEAWLAWLSGLNPRRVAGALGG
ncbi:MAG: hypothetical protein KGK30_08360, partial [Elusimicrobia bacterium]|nr:hypothetical protein [Elusimicrobiota bacterium]